MFTVCQGPASSPGHRTSHDFAAICHPAQLSGFRVCTHPKGGNLSFVRLVHRCCQTSLGLLLLLLPLGWRLRLSTAAHLLLQAAGLQGSIWARLSLSAGRGSGLWCSWQEAPVNGTYRHMHSTNTQVGGYQTYGCRSSAAGVLRNAAMQLRQPPTCCKH